MEYNPSDSSGTDDDLPPTHHNRGMAGQISGNGRTAVMGGLTYPRVHNDMETQIHRIEQEAYSSVLRAFKAQSDAITWEKESLITELRKELRVSDEEHRELLAKVNADDVIRSIRDWRKAGGVQSGLHNNVQPVHDTVPSPTVSASRKKQRTAQSVPPMSSGLPSPALQSQAIATPVQPTSSAMKRGVPPEGARGKKHKPGQTLHRVSSTKSVQYSSAGPNERGQSANQSTSALVPADPSKAANPLIGRRVMTRWPEDNNFYEAVITDYNPDEGLHALVYDMNTKHETWEWVNLKEISPSDIRWDGEDPGLSHQVSHGGPGRGVKRPAGQVGPFAGAGSGRENPRSHLKKDIHPSLNGTRKKRPDNIEILNTEVLIKEVERVFSLRHPDPREVEKAKGLLKDHEQSLINALAKLADMSDGITEERGHHL